MEKKSGLLCLASVLFTVGLFIISSFSEREQRTGYLLENDKDVAIAQPGPHNGGGISTAYSFFDKSAESKLVFRKRALHPGSAIGYHLQKEEEIYYIVSGTGEMQMNGQSFNVQAGDAILTLPGSSHGLKQTGDVDLVVIINYGK